MNSNHGSTPIYKFIRLVGAPFRFQVVGLENVQDDGPAIYVCNHLGSIGPIEAILSLPVRCYPWVIGEMTDPQRAPGYLYDDLVHPTWGLNGRFGMLVSTLVSRIAVGLLNGLGSISVDTTRNRTVAGLRRSLALLAEGENLLIFPEDPSQPPDPETQIRPFQCGFIGLCHIHGRDSGSQLPVYPMAVHAKSRMIAVGEALFFENRGDRRQASGRLHHCVSELYRTLEIEFLRGGR